MSGESPRNVVDIVVIGSRGLKKLPDSFTSEAAIADGLFFTSVEVSEIDDTFERQIRIPDETDSGNYQLLVFSAGIGQ